jgi:hypothetical protein
MGATAEEAPAVAPTASSSIAQLLSLGTFHHDIHFEVEPLSEPAKQFENGRPEKQEQQEVATSSAQIPDERGHRIEHSISLHSLSNP